MNEPSMSASCRGIARELEIHASALRRGGVLPEHAVACAACARRIRLAAALGDGLRARPEWPAAISSSAVLAKIHEHAIEALEQSPVGATLAEAMRVTVAAEDLPWPVQKAEGQVAVELSQSGRATPGWLWHEVRARVATNGAGANGPRRASSVGMIAAVAASAALLAVFGWRIGRSEGTTSDLQIVFVPVSELPSAMHPTAALRQALPEGVLPLGPLSNPGVLNPGWARPSRPR